MSNIFDTTTSADGRRSDFSINALIGGHEVVVQKSILFDKPTLFDEFLGELTNLALLDVLPDNKLSDSARSGYKQTGMIFLTVADTLFKFLIGHPNEIVYFQGSDPDGTVMEDEPSSLSSRQRLYNIILSKQENYEMAINYFRIDGVYWDYTRQCDEVREFLPNSAAKAFIIQLKN